MSIKQGREFVTIADGARLFRKVLQNDPGVVGTAEKGAIDALRAALHERRGSPHQGDTKKSAERDARLGMRREYPGEESRKKENCRQCAEEQKSGEAALDQNVTRTPPQKHRNLEHAVFHHGVTERERIKQQRQGKEGIHPETAMIAYELFRDSFQNQGKKSEYQAAEHDPRLTSRLGRVVFAQPVPNQRDHAQNDEGERNQTAYPVCVVQSQKLVHPNWPAGIPSYEPWNGLTQTKRQRHPFQPRRPAIQFRPLRKNGKKEVKEPR